MKRVLLLRHAKSDWRQALADFERPLNSRGREDARAMGRHIATRGFVPGCIVSSTAVRARETVELICAGMSDRDAPHINYNDQLYLAPADQLRTAAADELHEYDRVMVVAHNPGMESALLTYCPQAPAFADGKLMPTCALAVIELSAGDGDCYSDYANAKLIHHTRPSEIDR